MNKWIRLRPVLLFVVHFRLGKWRGAAKATYAGKHRPSSSFWDSIKCVAVRNVCASVLALCHLFCLCLNNAFAGSWSVTQTFCCLVPVWCSAAHYSAFVVLIFLWWFLRVSVASVVCACCFFSCPSLWKAFHFGCACLIEWTLTGDKWMHGNKVLRCHVPKLFLSPGHLEKC